MIDGVAFGQSGAFHCSHYPINSIHVCEFHLSRTFGDFLRNILCTLDAFLIDFSLGMRAKSLYRNPSLTIKQIKTFIEVNLNSRNKETNLKLLVGLLFLLMLEQLDHDSRTQPPSFLIASVKFWRSKHGISLAAACLAVGKDQAVGAADVGFDH